MPIAVERHELTDAVYAVLDRAERHFLEQKLRIIYVIGIPLGLGFLYVYLTADSWVTMVVSFAVYLFFGYLLHLLETNISSRRSRDFTHYVVDPMKEAIKNLPSYEIDWDLKPLSSTDVMERWGI